MAVSKGTIVSRAHELKPAGSVDGHRALEGRRQLQPRPPIIVRPSYVSDLTCFVLLGLTPRKFRECIAPKCERVSRLGHTVAVALDEAERVMRLLATAPGDVRGDVDADDNDQPQTVDEVLNRLGRERVA